MEVKKLYYEDSHRKEFTAQVQTCEPTADGWEVTLDATAFYPEGGGQAWDLGTLGGANVRSVRERGAQVVHLCDRALAVGETVHGCIDWERRFDLMQQHSGEHIVSGIVHRLFGYHNVGFHMGQDLVTIDFDGPIDPQTLEQIETQANRAVWENLPLRCWYPSQEELPTVPYRRKRDLPWPVRIVEIPGVDLCACCGTQVKYTGEIGIIKLFSCIKFHQGVRIEMACGGRALRLLQQVYGQNRQVMQVFSAKMLETGEAARRANAQLAQEKFQAVQLKKQLFAALAESCRDVKDPLYIRSDLDPGQVRELADAIAKVCRGIAMVFSGTDEAGYALCLVSAWEDVRPAGKALTQALKGRGGGKADAFQGKVPATAAEIRNYLGKMQ